MPADFDPRCLDPCLFCHGDGADPRRDRAAMYAHRETNAIRREAGLPEITEPPPKPKRGCGRCGGNLDDLNPQCVTCRTRHRGRLWLARHAEDWKADARVA
jgi:hypothetical protein